MCGRYASSRKPDDLVSYFEIQDPPEDVLPPDKMTGPDPAVDRVIRHGHRLILSLALDRVARELPAP